MPGFALIALALAAPSVPAPAETRCGALGPHGSSPGVTVMPDLHVLAQTAAAGAFSPGLAPGSAIECGRSDFVPAENDWKVLAAGYPLFIVDANPGADRIGVLEISDGQVRYRAIHGQFTPDEATRVQARLNAFQLHFQS
jgi:hypothetical protein